MRKGTISLKEWCIDNDRFDILSSFDEKKNGFSAAEIGRAMSKKVWWTCQKSAKHSYLCSTANRTKGRSCPYCAGKKILVGDNETGSMRKTRQKAYIQKNAHRVHIKVRGGNVVIAAMNGRQ